MSRKLFVGNLPYSATEDDLRELFEPFGAIANVRLPMDAETNRNRGFGFVEMTTEEDALQAIADLHGSTLGTRQIRVELATEKPHHQRHRPGDVARQQRREERRGGHGDRHRRPVGARW